MPRRESTWQTIFYSKWFLVSNVIILVLVLSATFRNFYYDYQVRKEIRALEEQSKNLENKNLQTLELLEHVKSQKFVEEKARIELNLVKPGENILVIQGEPTTTSINRQKNENMLKQEKVSNPQKWWKYFFEHDNS